MKNVLIVVGSLRKGSFNRQMAKVVEEILKDRVNISYLEFSDLPFMNEDIEFPTPAPVERVRKEIESADGIWICTPEYNSKLPAVVKNMLDWISRPNVKGKPGNAAQGKKVTYSTVGGRRAGFGVRSALADVVSVLGMVLVANEGTGISFSPDAFKTGIMVFDDYAMNSLKKQADIFVKALNNE